MAAASPPRSPAAFRRALTDRLRNLAETSRWSLPQLQRQMAYDRLLERLYLADTDWILKGAAALLARNLAVRATIDVDLYRSTAVEISESDLRAAARQDIGDWFRFEIGPGQPLSAGVLGDRLPVTAYVGIAVWCHFHVDLVGPDTRITGNPEQVPPLAPIVLPEIRQHGYLAYPLVDHVADKTIAILQSYGPERLPSTRYKDLVDLVAIVSQSESEAEAQRVALESQADRRGITLPFAFSVPDRALWEPGYAAEAARSLLQATLTLDEALTVVGGFLTPLLDGSAAGRWDPRNGCWVS